MAGLNKILIVAVIVHVALFGATIFLTNAIADTALLRRRPRLSAVHRRQQKHLRPVLGVALRRRPRARNSRSPTQRGASPSWAGSSRGRSAAP